MTKLSKRHVDSQAFGKYVNNLWSAFTLMESKEDIRLLFKDLFTSTEYKMFTKRLEIARRLLDGELYESIIRDLSVTARTITAVSDALSEGGEGYRKAHEKLNRIDEARRKRQTEHLKNLSNPWRRSFRRKTMGGVLLKAGVKAIDKAITKKLKQRTAKRVLAE